MKTNASARFLPFVLSTLAAALSLAPAAGLSQATGTPTLKPGPADGAVIFGLGGKFKTTDGVSGTFRQTEVSYGPKSRIQTVIFTRDTDQATRTEQTTDLTNADGSRTETLTVTDYGASSAFASNRTLVGAGRGQTVGQGTYTTADGVSGTLTTLETLSSGVDVLTTVYRDPAGGISTEQRTQTGAGVGDKTVVKTLTVDSSGKATSVVQTRTPVSEPVGHLP